MTLANLSDEELLSSLTTVCFESRRLLGRLLMHLIEVEDRRLDRRSACSSLYVFCQRRLGMSESEAVRRIEAVRLVKRFPRLLGHVERGEIHLTALNLLRDHFTDDNVDELVVAAQGKTKRELQELLVAKAPKPDIMPTLTALPMPSGSSSPSPEQVAPARLEPLAPSRHRLELTIGDEVRAKLERARDLLGHRIPNRDLEAVLDRALDALLGKLEKERRPVLREVVERDGEQCSFVDEQGNRCMSRTRLELDHIVPRARGGPDGPPNRRVLCRAHNQLCAEQAFGREHVERQIHLRQRRSRDPAVDVAERALTKMGFRIANVRRTLRELYPPGATAPPMPVLIREALVRISR